MIIKLSKADIKVSILEDINLLYFGYDTLSKETRQLCAIYNRERKKIFRLRDKVINAMIKDYYIQKHDKRRK
jgi:hypothetical protein